MLLGHQTNPNITNIYKIMQSGYLKPGSKTGVVRMWGWDKPTKYIYLMFFDIAGGLPHFELDSNLLLDNIAWLNKSWSSVPSKNAIKVDGSKINSTQLQKILRKYRKSLSTDNSSVHEILLEKDIDLVKYLQKIRLVRNDKSKKTYKKLLILMKKKYPNVKIINIKNN